MRRKHGSCGAQVGILQERLRHVDSTAQQARRLHAALNEAALVLKNPDSGTALSRSTPHIQTVFGQGCMA